MLGKKIGVSHVQDGAIVLTTDRHLRGIGAEGFVIRSTRMGGHPVTLIAANRDIGVLYGAFAFLRLIQTRRDIAHLNITDAPKLPLRVLDHWDNLDRTVERGYAGPSHLGLVVASEDRSAIRRLRPRQCLNRNQRRGAQQRQRRPENPHARISEESRGAGDASSGLTESASISRSGSAARYRSAGCRPRTRWTHA